SATLPRMGGRLIYGEEVWARLVLPTTLIIVALGLQSLSYNYHRGAGRMGVANVLQVFGLAVAPNLAFLLFGDLETVLWATAAFVLLFTLPALLPALLKADGQVSRERSALLRYGLPRVPGDLALGGLLTIPVYVAGALHGLSAGGQVGVGITLLNITAAAFAPVGLLLLPSSATQLAQGRYAELELQVKRTLRVTLFVSLVMFVAFEWLATPLLTLYLGEAGSTYVPMGRLLFLATPALAFFIALRALLDAYFVSPRNGINLLVAFGVLLVWCLVTFLLNAPVEWIGAGVVVALYLLAFRTWRDVSWVREELVLSGARSGDQLRIVFVIPGSPDGNEFPFARRQARVFGERFGARVDTYFLRSRMDPIGLLRARRELKAVIRAARPDLVMVHYGTVTALFTVLTSSAPVVVTFHGSDLNPTPTDGRIRDFLGRLFSQLAAFFAAGIITVSEGLRDQLWWRREEVQVLPMGIDLERFKPLERDRCRRELGWPKDQRVVLFNNNNPALKRVDIAEAAVAGVRQSGLDVRLETVAGAVDPDRMPLLLNASDVLLLCSDREGSPTMVKEAMACAVPVVTSDVGDVRQRLKGVTPGVVTTQDPVALAAGLLDVLRTDRRSNGPELATSNGIDADDLDARTFAMLRSILVP
ncbi:MAG: glycosyltransferase, partial [Flavobacteriales bacterium]|nr:glycosyltransferase [Flavobacteriales bacterium]